MGVIIALRGAARLALVTLIVIVVGGLGTWLIAPGGTDTVGASGVVFGYATYLFTRGLFNRSVLEIADRRGRRRGLGRRAALEPRAPAGISWQGHACGAVAGVVAAWAAGAAAARPTAQRAPARRRALGAPPGAATAGSRDGPRLARVGSVACARCGSSPASSRPGASTSATTSARSPSTSPARTAARRSTASSTCTRSPSPYDPAGLRESVYDTAATLLAAGLDPERCIFFRQSDVHEHTELTLAAVERHRLRRAQPDDPVQGQVGRPARARVRRAVHLPGAEAADVLAYRAHEVPVGEDQRQHVELMRDVAERFNARFGETLVVPEVRIPDGRGADHGPAGARAQDVDDRRQRAGHRATCSTSPTRSPRRFRSAVTDSGSEVRRGPDKPGITNLIEILAAVRGSDAGGDRARVRRPRLRGVQAGRRRRGDRLPGAGARALRGAAGRRGASWRRILAAGAEKARAIASDTLVDVREAMGVGPVRAARLTSAPWRS